MTPITRALSAALLHFVWQGLAVGILTWAALWLLRTRQAALRYGVCCAALATLVALPAATAWRLYEGPAAEAAMAAGTRLDLQMGAPSARMKGGVDWMAAAQAWAIPIWSSGVLVFSLRMAWGCALIARLRRTGEPAGGPLGSTIAALAGRMGLRRQARVLITNAMDSPSVTGWLRPVILVPAAAVAGLSPEQLEAVVAHELAHVLRYDYLVNLLQMGAEALLFYHPAVWWISSRIREERELCCDDLAVAATGGALPYARALATLERMRGPRPAPVLGSTDGPLFYRIRRLAAGGAEHRPTRPSGAIAVAIGLACVGLFGNWARGQEPARDRAVRAGAPPDDRGVTVETTGPLLHRKGIGYPERLRKSGVRGVVSIDVTLDEQGEVADARVLSGPNELRRAALASVLDWHFAPGSGTTRTVQISFQPPRDEPEALAREQALLENLEREAGGRKVALAITRTPEESMEAFEQTRLAEKLLEEETNSLRAKIAELDSGADSAFGVITELRGKLAELEKRRDAARLAIEISAKEAEAGACDSCPRVSLFVSPRHVAGTRLAAIEIRGLSAEFARELESRLPAHRGDILTEASLDATHALVMKLDEHLEAAFETEPQGTVLRIGAPGDGEMLRLK